MNKNIRFIIIFWAPVLFWMGVIFLGSCIPGKQIPEIGIQYADKLAHIVEYLILGFLIIRAVLNSNPSLGLTKIVILSIIIALLYGASDEWHQRFVTGRIPDFFDFLADFIGINIGIFLYKKRGEGCRQ